MVVTTAREVDIDIVVVVGVVRVVVSHRLHVLSQPPGETRVSHKPLAKMTWHSDSSKEFDLPLHRSVVVDVVVAVEVVVVSVVEVLELVLVVVVLVDVVYVEVLVVKVVDVDVVLVVVSHPLHVLSH